MSTLSDVVAVVQDGPVADAVRAALQAHDAVLVTAGPGTAVPAAVEQAVAEHGRVDLVVLSAGQPADVPIGELDETAWASASAGLADLVQGLRASLHHMVPRGSGRVVVTTGVEAKVGRGGAAAATAVSHAAFGLVKAASKEVGPSGVTVNAVMGAAVHDGPLTGRATEPAEVAAVVVMLAAPHGGGISGTAFPVDGGVAPY